MKVVCESHFIMSVTWDTSILCDWPSFKVCDLLKVILTVTCDQTPPLSFDHFHFNGKMIEVEKQTRQKKGQDCIEQKCCNC